MAEDNNNLVDLGNLGTASQEDVNKAVSGQPEPVQSEKPKPAQKDRATVDLGPMSNYMVKNDEGVAAIYNPFDNNLNFDLDQFETRRRRVNESNMLSGLINGVEGLEEGFLYTGGDSTYNRSEEAQGYLNKMKNGVTQFVGETAINVGQGFATLLYGLPSAIVNKDLTKLYDNTVANNLDTASEEFQKFYEIKRGGNQSTGKEVANFLFDDFLGGASFVAGAIATEMAFTALSAATLGGAAPAQAAATAGLVARGARMAKQVVNGGRRLMGASLVDDALRQAAQLGANATRQTAGQAIRAAGKAIKTPQALQASVRVGRQLLTGAGMESGMEARHMLNAAVETQKRQYEELNGQGSFTEEMGDAFREEISGYGDAVFGVNMALVGASNMLMFPKLFGVGLNRGMRTTKFVDTSKMTAKARQAIAKEMGIPVGRLPKLVDAGRATRMGRLGRTTRVLRNAGYEGLIEEGGQGAISRTAEDYIAHKYDPTNVQKTASFTESFLDGLQGSYTTKDGLKEIGIGMLLSLTGAPMIARSDQGGLSVKLMGGYYGEGGLKARRRAEDKALNNLVKLVENDGEVGKILQSEIQNMNIQNGLSAEMDKAVAAGDLKAAKDIETNQIFAHASSKILTGRYDDAIAEYGQILEEMTDEEYRNELGDAGKNMSDEEVRAFKAKQLETYKRRMGEVRKAYDQAGEVYRGEDPDVHTGIANLLYNVSERDAREKSIAESMAEQLGQDLNGDQILDLVKAQEVLDMDDAVMENYRLLQQQIRNVEKSLETKRKRNIIKNIDPEKAKRRQEELVGLEEGLIELQERKDAMIEQMEKKAEKAEYTFDETLFNELLKTHDALRRTGQTNTTFDKEGLERLEEDLRAISADRQRMIALYNDMITPGGVARFQENVKGKIEEMANRNDPQKAEEAAAQESAEAVGKEGKTPTDPTDEVTQSRKDTEEQEAIEEGIPDDSDVTPEADNSDIPFTDRTDEPDLDFTADGEASNVSVQDPYAATPEVDDIQADADNASPIAQREGVVPPNEGDMARPTDSGDVHPIKLYIDTNVQRDEQPGQVSLVNRDGNEEILVGGIDAGTEVLMTIEDNFLVHRLRGKVIKREPLQYISKGLQEKIHQAGGTLTSRVQNVIGLQRGGTKVVKRIGDRTNPLEVGMHLRPSDIRGVYVRTTKEGVKTVVGDKLQSEDVPKSGPRSDGNAYITTRDTRTGELSYHLVGGTPLNENTARALIRLERAFDRLSRNQADAADMASIENMMEVFEGVSLDPRQAHASFRIVLNNFLYTKSSFGAFKQNVRELGNKAQNEIGYFNNSDGIELYYLDEDGKPAAVSSKNNEDHMRLVTMLSRQPRNIVLSHNEGDTVVPGLELSAGGTVTAKQAIPVERYYHANTVFLDRAPLIVDNNVYNTIPTKVVLEVGPVEVPTTPRRDSEPAGTLTEEQRARYEDAMFEDVDELPAVATTEKILKSPMARAGRLYLVDGLSQEEVNLVMNEFAGRIAEELVTHNKTKRRRKAVNAQYFKNKLRQEVQDFKAFAESQPKSARRDYLIDVYGRMLEQDRFDRLADLSFLEVLRNSKDIVQLKGNTIGEALSRLLDDSNQEVESLRQEDGEVERAENPMAAFDEHFAFGVDPNATLRLEAKMALMTIRHSGAVTAQSRGLFGKKFIDFKTLTDKLNRSLVGTDYTWDAVSTRLEALSNTHPEFQDVLRAFTTRDPNAPDPDRADAVLEMMRNQFVVFAAKEESTRETVLIGRGKYANVQVFNSNNRNMQEFAKKDLISHFVAFGFFNPDKTVNAEKVTKFLGKINAPAANTGKRQEQVAKAFANMLGIAIPSVAFNEQNMPKILVDFDNPMSDASLFGQFRSALRDALDDPEQQDNPILTDPRLQDFVMATVIYRDNFIQNSSKDGDGNTIHHFSAPKLLNQRLRDMAAGNGAINTPLSKEMRAHGFRVSYFGGVKTRGKNGKQRDFHAAELQDKIYARLGLFGNDNTYSKTGRLMSKHMMPTLADKSTMPILEVPSLPIQMVLDPAQLLKPIETWHINDFMPRGGMRQVYNMRMKFAVQAEIDRLRVVKRGRRDLEGGDPAWDTLTNAQRKARGFVLMPQLNPLARRFMDGELTIQQFEEAVHQEALGIMVLELNDDFINMMRELRNTAYTVNPDSGLLGGVMQFRHEPETYKSKARFTYVKNHTNPEADWSSKDIQRLGMPAYVAKFAIESLAVNTSVLLGTMGDPGAFVKGDSHKTAVNLGKRLAALIAPGTAIPEVTWEFRGKVRSNAVVRTLVIPNRIVKESEHFDYLQSLGQSAEQLNMQKNYDSADAAEYTTTEEHLSILYAQGKIRKDQLNALLAKSKSNEKFTVEDLKWFQPMKPVTSGIVNGHMLYVKSASFPLVEQLTRGTQLDKLRQFMEDNNIQRAAFESAVKVGDTFEDKKEVFSGSEVNIEEGLENQVIEYDRKYMRIQQEVPTSTTNEKVHGSQPHKLAFAGLAYSDVMFELDGKPIDGRKLYGKFMEALRDEVTAREDAFLEKYGMIREGGMYAHTPKSMKLIADRLQEEGISRGYDVNELAHMYFNPELGQFETPLTQGPSADRINSVLMAIYRKELLELRIEGFSGPIRPEIGMAELDDEAKSSIVWVTKDGTRLYNGKKLKAARDGKPDQIILPWKYKAKLSKYQQEDGTIRMEDLPQELFNVFAYRIPSQQKSSSASFEIVGFLPAEYGDTLIVPEELVGRMGQDYDIDKMFGIMYTTRKGKDGKIEIIRDGDTAADRIAAARNRQLDIYIATMRSNDQRVNQAIHSPVTDGYGESLAQNLEGPKSQLGMPLTITYNEMKAAGARSAKRAIGVFATHDVVQAQIESATNIGDIKIKRPVYIAETREKWIKGSANAKILGAPNIHDDTFLLPYTYENENGETVAYRPVAGTRQEQFSRLLNHAVDNENNQLLSRLGINEHTWMMWTGLTHMGYNEETIALFVKQPVVQQFIKEQEARNALMAEFSVQDNEMFLRSLRKRALSQLGVENMTEFYEKVKAKTFIPLNKTDMLDVAQGKNIGTMESLAMDVQIASALEKLIELQGDLILLQSIMSMDTARPKTRAELDYRLQRANDFSTRDLDDGALIFNEGVIEMLENNTVSGIIYGAAKRTNSILNLPGESVYDTVLSKSLLGGAEELGWNGEKIDTYLKGVKGYLHSKWVLALEGKSSAELRASFKDPETGLPQRLLTLRHEKPEVRNNVFARQLLAITDVNDDYGVRLEFTGDRVLNASSTETHQGFLSLLTSKDAEVAEFGRDLVLYYMVTAGGKLKSRGFDKFVPAEFLQELGIRQALGFTNDEYGYFKNDGIMHDQIMRHNPQLAPYVADSEVKGSLIEPSDRVLAVGYFRNKNKLYRLTGAEANGKAVAQEVSTLGNYLSDEYLFGREIESSELMPDENAMAATTASEYTGEEVPEYTGQDARGLDALAQAGDKYDPYAGGVTESNYDPYAGGVTEDTGQEDGDVIEDGGGAAAEVAADTNPLNELEDQTNELPDNATMTLKEFLDHPAVGKENSPFLVHYADKYLQTGEGGMGPVRVSIINDPNASRGGYNAIGNVVTLNKAFDIDRRTIIHELVHAASTRAVNLVQAQSEEYLVQSMGEYAKDMVAAVNKVEGIRKKLTTEANIKAMGLDWATYQSFLRGYVIYKTGKAKGGVNIAELTPPLRRDYETFNNRENLDAYYGLVNTNEFMAEVLSNPEFTKRFAQVDKTRQTSLFKDFFDLIDRILQALGVADGNYMAREAIQATLEVLDQQADVQGDINSIYEADEGTNEVPGYMALLNGWEFLPEISEMPESHKDEEALSMESVEKLQDYKKKRIRQFEEMLGRYKDSREMRKRIRQRIAEEKQELEYLNDDSVKPEVLLTMGRRELEDARNVIDRSSTKGHNLDRSISAMQNVMGAIEFYDKVKELVPDENARQQVDELRAQAAVLRDNFLEKARQQLITHGREKVFKGTKAADMYTANSFGKIEDVSQAMSRFMDASRQGRIELSYLDRIVRDASIMQRADFNERTEAYLEKTRAFQEGAYFGKHGWDGMVQLDAMGNPTPRLITAMSGTWQEAVRAKRAEMGEDKAGYYKWIKSQTVNLNLPALYDYKDVSEVKRKDNALIMSKLVEEVGELAAEDILKRQDALMQEFVDAREAQFDVIDLTESDPEVREEKKAAWVKEHGPSNSYEFRVTIPKRTINGKSTGYYDARFDEMQQDRSAVEYYKFYTEQMRDMLAMLPSHALQQRDNSLIENGLFIPAIQKSLTADLLKKDWREGINVLTEQMLASLTVSGEDSLAKLVDPVTGKPREELPVNFVKPLADSKQQDYNMDHTFMAFAMMATTYHSKNMIEDKVRMTRTVLSSASIIGKDSFGNKLLTKMGFEQAGKQGVGDRENLMRVVDTVVNNYYGFKTDKDVQRLAPEFMWTTEQKARVASLEKEVAETSDPELKARKQQELDAARPRMSAVKGIHKVQQFVQAKGMGWNLPAATVNLVFGKLAIHKHAAGRRDFDEKSARRAGSIMLHSALNNITLNKGYTQTATARKIQNGMIVLDQLKDFTEVRWDTQKYAKHALKGGQGAARSQGLSKLRMYEIQRSSEYMVYGQVMVSMLDYTKVDGKSLWEYMDEDGIIQLDGYRPGEAKFIELVNRMDQVQKRIHGNYDPNSPIAAKQTMFGRLLMQFRSWFPEALETRVGAERYDAHLDRTVKGTYRTMIDVGFKQSLRNLLPLMVPSYLRTAKMDTLDKGLSEVDQENMRKFAAGLRQWINLSLLMLFLKAFDDDDDKETRWLLNYGLNIASRVENDLTTFAKPNSIIDMTQGDFLAIIGFLSDIEAFSEATIQTLMGDGTIPTGKYAGKSRMLHHGGKLIPHTGAYQRLLNNIQSVMND